MVSPRSQRSRRSVDHMEDSNSTASLFLGGARRAWMPAASLPGPISPPIRDAQPTPAVADISLADARPLNTLSSSLGPLDAAPMSPVIPGGNLQSSASLADKPDTPTAALPSPVPSTNSHPSPVIAHNRPSDAGLSPAPDRPPVAVPQNGQDRQNAVQPSQPVTVAQQDPSTTTAAPSSGGESAALRLSLLTNGLPALSPVMEPVPGQSPSLATPGHGNAPENTGLGPRPSPQGPTGIPSGLILPGDETWAQWKASLRYLKEEARNSPSPIAGPRVRLLEDACEYKDLLYLVLHQLYCRQSLDDKGRSEFPVLREKHCQEGMLRVQELIEPNNSMAAPMVWDLAKFPQNLEDLKHQAWYGSTVRAISLCLTCIATRFADLKARLHETVYRRGYPLMVDELRTLLEATSPVLMTIIFVSTCRHLYGADSMATLNRLFRQDLRATLEGRASNVMQEYLKIPMRPRPVPIAVPITQPSPSASPSSTSQAVPGVAGGLPSSGSQSAVASPVVSVHSDSHPGQNSPHMRAAQPLSGQQMVQSPGYQHFPYPPPQRPVQHGQTIPGQQPQMNRVYYQGQWRQYTPMQTQLPPQSQDQVRYNGLIRTALQGQGQVQQSQVQTQQPAPALVPSNTPSLTSLSSQPLPHRPEYAHVPPQPHHLPPRPYVNLPQVSIQQVSSSATRDSRIPSSRPRLSVPLLPPSGYRLPHTVNPNPSQMALHQADLRDPVKRLVELGPNREMVEIELFQFLGNFVVPPQIIDPKELRYDWSFSIAEEDCQRFPRLQQRGEGKRGNQIIQPGCNVFRLRCISLPPSEQDNLERLWPTKSGVWPSVLYIFVNGIEMYVRRKPHNGKDIPLDISKHLRPGNNTVTVHLLLGPDECRDFKYAIGIEAMEISKYERVRDLAGIITSDQTRMDIQKRLAPPEDNDDLAVVTDSLTISIIDPFTAQTFKTPVRTQSCNHLDCFDHETFIRTRKNRSGPTPMNDNWRCPICNADARPQLLRVDQYFVAVRDYLVATNQLEGAQAIQVKADGTWIIQLARDDSPSASRTPRADRSSAPASGKRKGDSTEAGPDASRTKHERPPVGRTASQPSEPAVIEID